MEQYFLETDQCQLKVYSINPAQSHTAILFYMVDQVVVQWHLWDYQHFNY